MENNNVASIEKRLKGIKARDIMSRFAITTNEHATVSDLAHLLMRFKISGVPVVTRQGEMVGIVTATDLFRIMGKITGEIERGIDPQGSLNIKVQEIMTKEVSTVSEETTLFEIMQIMCNKNIHTLPVVTQEGMIGIIGRRDIINACYVNHSVKLKP